MYNLLKTSFFLFIFLISTHSNSQIIYEDGFPTEFHGIWSDNCAKPSEYAVRIDKHSSYEVTDYGTYLDIPKIRIVGDYLVVIYPGTKEYPDEWYNFLKIENNNLVIRYEPENFDKNDFSFLDQKDDDTYYFVKCEIFPNKYQNYVAPFNNLLDENVLSVCINNSLESIACINNLFNYFDIYPDGELSVAELTQMSKLLVNYLFLDGHINTIMEDTPIEDKYLLATGTSFTFAPSFSQLLLVNYDYNNSDSLSLDELLNNKSDFVQNINFILKTNFSTLENAIELLEDVF